MNSEAKTLNVVVLGAGSIGCYLAGCILAHNGSTEQSAPFTLALVGRPRLQHDILTNGLTLTDWQGRNDKVASSLINFTIDYDALASADFIFLCVKSQDTQSAAQIIQEHAKGDATVISFQNGVANGDILASMLSQPIVKGMVPFNVFYQGNGRFHCGTEGHLAIEDPKSICMPVVDLLERAQLPVTVYDDISSVQYGKLIMNLNNAVNALSGIPLKQQLGERAYRLVMAEVLKEALFVLKAEGIAPARTGKVIPKLMPTIMMLPNFLFNIVAASTLKIDPQARSSMYEDLQLGRTTEIDFLNGEIERLGKKHKIATPVNSNIIALIKQAQGKNSKSPMLSAAELLHTPVNCH
jgi:2-dehydropantoate 2-reductase